MSGVYIFEGLYGVQWAAIYSTVYTIHTYRLQLNPIPHSYSHKTTWHFLLKYLKHTENKEGERASQRKGLQKTDIDRERAKETHSVLNDGIIVNRNEKATPEYLRWKRIEAVCGGWNILILALPPSVCTCRGIRPAVTVSWRNLLFLIQVLFTLQYIYLY